MRILIQNRPDAFEVPGGEAVQIKKTADALCALGHEVNISTDLTPDLRNYDVVHLFNLTMSATAYVQALNARAQRKPIVLSTIYYTWDEFESKGRDGLYRLLLTRLVNNDMRERIKALIKGFRMDTASKAFFRQAVTGYRRQQIDLLTLANVILPNSYLEAEAVRRDFPEVRKFPLVKVVPNAADEYFYDASSEVFIKQYGLKDFILCVANINSRKNQVALIEALHGINTPVVFIGGHSPYHRNYYRKFLSKIRDHNENNEQKIHYLGPLGREMIAAAYKAAAVHVLPSWLETPGLASLEAALSGCRVVTTNRGSAPEYFGDQAHYCDPDSVDSIRSAVVTALASPPSSELRDRVRKDFTWHRAAVASLEGYRLAIDYYHDGGS